MGIGGLSQGGQPGQVALLDELERRTATGGHVVDAFVEAELGQGRRAVAPAHDGEAGRGRHRLGQGDGALGEAGVLEQAHGPVPEEGAGPGHDLAERGRRLGSDVEPLPPVGDAGADHLELVVGAEGEDVLGQDELVAALGQEVLAGVDPVGLLEGVAHPVALGQGEGERHGPAHHEGVDLVEEGLDDAQLVAHLGPAQDGHKRPVGVVEQAAEDLDLLGQEASGGAGQALRRADDRGVRPVGRAEGVVHVEVEPVDQAVDEGGIVGLLARVEAEVLQQLDARRQLGQPLPDRRHRVLLVGLALGPAEVGAGDDGRAVLLQPLDRGQGGPDPQVVVDLPVGDGDVEVGPEQDPLSRRVGQVLQRGDVHQLLTVSSLSAGVCGCECRRPRRAAGNGSGVLVVGATDDDGEVGQAVGVAPLVVVPAEDLDQAAHGHGGPGLEGARGGRADDVGRHDRVLRVDDHLRQRAGLRRRLERGVDLVDGDVTAEDGGEVGDGAVLHRDPEGGAVEAALHGLQHQRRGPSGTRGAGDDVLAGGPHAAQVARLVHHVEQRLVVGVGVHRGHKALLHAEGVVENLHHGDEAVRRARCVGHDLVVGGVERVVVDAHHERGVDIGGGGGDDHPGGAGVDVTTGLVAVGEEAGGLDHHVNPDLGPREGLGVGLAEHLHQVATDGHAVVGDLDRFVEASVGRVVLEQVGVHRRRGEVVDGHDFDLGSASPAGSEEDPSDATETVDANPYWPILRHE